MSELLPPGWMNVNLGDLLSGIESGSSFKCEERPPTPNEVGVVKISAVTWRTYQELESKTCMDERRIEPGLFIASGDFLFSRANTIELVGACVIVSATTLRVMLSDKILRLRFSRDEMKPWVLHFLRSKDGRAQIESLASGNQESMRNIGQERLRQIAIPIPPTSEQSRIVAKLEELLSDLDAGVAELKAAQKKLRQYRQSLLKAAVEGTLTAPWREAQRKLGTPTETGVQLLQRILTERRARWEAKQLAKFKEQGKAPPNDWQKKYPEPVEPDTTDLSELPEGWVWASAEQLCEFITKGTTPPKDLDDGRSPEIPFLRVTNLTDTGALDLSERVFVADSTHRGLLSRSAVFPGDVLMNIVCPPLGQVSLVPSDYPEWNINQAIAIFRAVPGISVDFLRSWLLSRTASNWLKARAKTTAGQTNLTLELCRALPVPLPPEREQSVINELTAAALDAASEQLHAVAKSIKQSAAQRQNILRASFAGQLVPQDPNDEPASLLLERIRAERAARAAANAPRLWRSSRNGKGCHSGHACI